MKVQFYEYSSIVTEAPELDALMADLQAVCEKHGVGFHDFPGYDGEAGGVYLVPFAEATWDWLTENLARADERIEWVARERRDARVAEDIAHTEARQRLAEEMERLEAAAARRMVAEGLLLAGKRYKIVPVDQ